MASTSILQPCSTFEQIRKAKEDNKGIIVIVGHDGYKSVIANRLRDTLGATRDYSVVDTEYLSLLETGLPELRRWASANSLRRLDGYKVKVVWALGGNIVTSRQLVTMYTVFGDYRQQIIVVIESATITHPDLQNCFGRKIRGITPSDSVLSVLSAVDGAGTFLISTKIDVDTNGRVLQPFNVWSGERVMLFGRTGAGKSSVAHMLTKGSLDIPSEEFKHGASAKGVTVGVRRGQGRGWFVTDTPGFGEARGRTIPTDEAVEKLKTFVSKVGGIHSYYIYVLQHTRLDRYDESVWALFRRVFSHAKENFCIVVTGQKNNFAQEDIDHLAKGFEGCKKFIYVNFESPSDDQDKSENLVALRKKKANKSLERLEEELANMRVTDGRCHINNLSHDRLSYIKDTSTARVGAWIQTEISEWLIDIFQRYVERPTRYVTSKARGRDKMDEDFVLLLQ
uniref:AIG1-type G domain-containing protein n=1 Tax=Physcomitrium patens TaxID=3218 RepID=A9RUI7_PHYPA|nr:hypothetical protein PHYPA_012611 [Physcomitrium patens]